MTEATREGSAETSDELGRQVLIHLSRSMRIASMHQLGNDAVGATVQGLMTALAAAAQDAGAMSVQVNGDAVFYNRLLVKPRGDAAEATNHLRRTFERLDISEIRLAGAPTLGLMMAFLAAFKTAGEPGATPLSALQLDGLVVRRSDETKRGRDIDVRRNVARCYAQLQVLAGASFDRVREGRAPQLGRLRRGLQALVDAGAGHSSLMIGLACSVEFNVDEAGHATAVTALVLVMGERLGLSRVEQASLGLKALLHEAGAVVIPAESSTTAIAPRIGALSALAVRMTAVPHESMALLSAVLDLPRAQPRHCARLDDDGGGDHCGRVLVHRADLGPRHAVRRRRATRAGPRRRGATTRRQRTSIRSQRADVVRANRRAVSARHCRASVGRRDRRRHRSPPRRRGVGVAHREGRA